MIARGIGEAYKIEEERNYHFLRLPDESSTDQKLIEFKKNAEKFKKLINIMEDLEFTQHQINTVYSIVSAILNLGEINFCEDNTGLSAVIENKEVMKKVAALLEINTKSICWALTNYCVIRNGQALRKRNSCVEAKDVRNVLANTLYARLVDYVTSEVNSKLSIGKQIL